MANLSTHHNALFAAQQYLESISEQANTAYYVFIGGHMPTADDLDLSIVDDFATVEQESYRNLIQGKRVGLSDANLMIRNIPWQSQVFSMYDDQDSALDTESFYCVVNAGSYSHVYKCLDNNNEAVSTVQPDFSQISGANTILYQTADGYRWKYMYSVDSATVSKFSTVAYFPVVPNTSVTSAAVAGALDIVHVDGTGRGYDNYLLGNFGASDLRISGNAYIYAISNSQASTVNGFYTGCLIYLSSGTGIGGYSRIVDYWANNIGNYVLINNPFVTPPMNGTTYQIYPEVIITGSGAQTSNAVCRALVNSLASNSVYRVEVFQRGAGYDYFVANAIANGVVAVPSPAELRCIYSPAKGHGFDAAEELISERLCFSVTFANNEGNTVLTTNQFREVGILRDPLFANVTFNFSEANSNFIPGEQAWKVKPVLLNQNLTINTTSNTLSCATADFGNQVSVGQYVYMISGDNLQHQLTIVSSVINSSAITIATNGYFTCTTTSFYDANVVSSASANAYVLTTTTQTNVAFTNVAGVFSSGDMVIGMNSGARGIIGTVARNGVTKDFNTFIGLYKYTGINLSGTFQPNEILKNDLKTADLHSVFVNGSNVTIYASNQIGGIFGVGGGNTIVGNTSGATTATTNRYGPEIVFGSGEMLYLERIAPVTLQNAQSETFKLIFEFA